MNLDALGLLEEVLGLPTVAVSMAEGMVLDLTGLALLAACPRLGGVAPELVPGFPEFNPSPRHTYDEWVKIHGVAADERAAGDTHFLDALFRPVARRAK